MNEITTRALTKIRALPKTPDAIANFLKERGCIGLPRSASKCPLSIYLKEEDTYVLVSRFMINIEHKGQLATSIEPAKGVHDFIVKMDNDKYPFLSTEHFLGEIFNDDSWPAGTRKEDKP